MNCKSCGVELTASDIPAATQDCGGDCLSCMAECGDPDCKAALDRLEPSPMNVSSPAALELYALCRGKPAEITLPADQFDRIRRDLHSWERWVEGEDTRLHLITSPGGFGTKVLRGQEMQPCKRGNDECPKGCCSA